MVEQPHAHECACAYRLIGVGERDEVAVGGGGELFAPHNELEEFLGKLIALGDALAEKTDSLVTSVKREMLK